MKRFLLVLSLGCLTLASSGLTWANQTPRALSTDSRVRVVAYDPNNVVTIEASQLVETGIQFGEDETIIGVENGDSAAWTVTVNKLRQNILFIKPTLDESNTSLLVMTDKNTYHFHLITALANTPDNKQTTYYVRFTYPQEMQKELEARLQAKRQLKESVINREPVDPFAWNWDYSFSARCAKDLVPVKAFDDGKFTYFQFSRNAEIPAIFIVDQNGNESLANWSMKGPYVVVSRLARQFSFRNGRVMSCIFNDNYQL